MVAVDVSAMFEVIAFDSAYGAAAMAAAVVKELVCCQSY
jgi:hypothetical protein